MVIKMKLTKNNMLLYAVTDRSWLNGKTLAEDVEKALAGGVTMLQLREKNLSEDEYIKEAIEIKKICRKYNVPLIINDNVNVAIKSGADGVHVGQDDTDVAILRKKYNYKGIIGATAHNVKEAIEAEKSGADYLGVGAIFSTSTKSNTIPITYDILKEVCSSVSIPVCAIGGINSDNILSLKDSGIDGVAVVSAIFASKDITGDTKHLKEIASKIVCK